MFVIFIMATLNANGQLRGHRISNKDVIERLTTLMLKGEYKNCIDSCQKYIRFEWVSYANKRHPYRDAEKTSYWVQPYDIEYVASILYLGSISAYQYSLENFDTHVIFSGQAWAKACASIYYDYLKENTPNDDWTVEQMGKYINYGERANYAVQFGEHFLVVTGGDHWGKKESKWFTKKGFDILDILANKLKDKGNLYPSYPMLQYKIYKFSTLNMLKKKDMKGFQEMFKKRFDTYCNMVKNIDEDNFNSELYAELNNLTNMLYVTVTEGELLKRIGNNYERFCMESLVKLQDLSYSLNGCSRYSMSSNYTLKDIQDKLEKNDCAILHFEAPVSSGHLYYKYDLGKRFRNYALVLTKDQEEVEVWHRGYISDTIVNNLDEIKRCHPNVNRFFYVGTPRMSFIDIAKNDASIVRLHSLSQILQPKSAEPEEREISFIGDINYTATGDWSDSDEDANNMKGTLSEEYEGYERLKGPAEELKTINSLFKKVSTISGDNATRNNVASEISRNRDIIHISTHGATSTNAKDDISPEDLILKKNVMDNSRLILSGYNDTPRTALSYLTGSDILKMKKIDSNIVFLDACLSGRGSVSVSGSVGMAEAFHTIGAKNIICYLQRVEDKVATQFSNLFYSELSKGKSCHDAFFNAKKSLTQQIKVILWE